MSKTQHHDHYYHSHPPAIEHFYRRPRLLILWGAASSTVPDTFIRIVKIDSFIFSRAVFQRHLRKTLVKTHLISKTTLHLLKWHQKKVPITKHWGYFCFFSFLIFVLTVTLIVFSFFLLVILGFYVPVFKERKERKKKAGTCHPPSRPRCGLSSFHSSCQCGRLVCRCE